MGLICEFSVISVRIQRRSNQVGLVREQKLSVRISGEEVWIFTALEISSLDGLG